MAWNKNLPANNSKIRLAPGYIRDNWDAIETGLVPYDYIQLQKQAGDPTTTANTGFLYSKDPGTGVTEAYYKNSAGSVIQLTSSARIGSSSTNLIGSTLTATNITFNGTYNNTQNSFCSAWGLVTSAGVLTTGFGVTASRISTGLYEITFSVALSGANYSIVATPRDTSSPNHNRTAMIVQQSATTFRVRTQRIDQGASSFEDCGIMFAVFGGR